MSLSDIHIFEIRGLVYSYVNINFLKISFYCSKSFVSVLVEHIVRPFFFFTLFKVKREKVLDLVASFLVWMQKVNNFLKMMGQGNIINLILLFNRSPGYACEHFHCIRQHAK